MQSNTIQRTIPIMLYGGLIGLFGDSHERTATGHGRTPFDEDDGVELEDIEDLENDLDEED